MIESARTASGLSLLISFGQDDTGMAESEIEQLKSLVAELQARSAYVYQAA